MFMARCNLKGRFPRSMYMSLRLMLGEKGVRDEYPGSGSSTAPDQGPSQQDGQVEFTNCNTRSTKVKGLPIWYQRPYKI